MSNFNAAAVTDACVQWIRDWFEANGKGCSAVLGISGGKDSSVTAALCVKALGAERVLGVLMPCGVQADIQCAVDLCDALGIERVVINVKEAVDGVLHAMGDIPISEQTRINLPPRIRMATLYAVSQSQNGRVANTCNLSEDWVGYSTRYGDSVGDFAPLSNLTVGEVIAIGSHLGLPEKFVKKPPIDGLCGQTDEDKLGFTYETLDKYIREGIEPDAETKKRIDHLHQINLFKLRYMDVYEYEG